MKVLHLISSGGMYGAEAVILQLMAEMDASGADSASLGVFSHSPDVLPALHGAALDAGFASELVACRGQVDLSVARSLRALARRTGADVIHAHGYKADIYTFAAFRGSRRPALVSTCHTWYDNDLAVRLYGAADRLVLRHFDQVVAVSAEVRERLLNAGVAPARAHLIRNGVRLGSSPDPSERSFSNGELRVGLVGRLAPEKGVDIFLQAAAQLSGAFPDASFVIAGEGPERPALESLLRELGIAGRVALAGQQADMARFYKSLDLLVSASRQEGLPMALLEGMAAGLPVVATRVGEVPQVVVHGETGLLTAPESAPELAAAIQRLLANPEVRDQFGRAGRDRVRSEFSAQRMTADYMDVYRQALSHRPVPQMLAGAAKSA